MTIEEIQSTLERMANERTTDCIIAQVDMSDEDSYITFVLWNTSIDRYIEVSKRYQEDDVYDFDRLVTFMMKEIES